MTANVKRLGAVCSCCGSTAVIDVALPPAAVLGGLRVLPPGWGLRADQPLCPRHPNEEREGSS